MALAILLSVYHHSYDSLLLVVPWAGVTFFGCLKELAIPWRVLVSILVAVPAANYVSTQSARDALELDQHSMTWTVLTLINGFCLLFALCILLVAAFLGPRAMSATTGSG
jgi:hypothetical protein